MAPRTGPLQSFRIIDLTAMISGPYGTQLLADQGADVIKVETEAGDLMRHAAPARNGMSAAFVLNNRNKRSVVLDLKSDSGQETLNRLIATADVFVQNFRPGVIERMGFGEEAVRAIRPDIVYVSISGFGEDGPYRDKRVYDPVIQALSGLMSAQGHGDKPRMMHTLVPDKLTAMTAAQAICAALLGREATGTGEHIRLSMLDATVAWNFPDLMLTQCLVGEENSLPVTAGVDTSAFATRDGHIVFFAASDAEWQGFVAASGRSELAADARFKTLADRMQHLVEMYELMRETVATGTTQEWLDRLDEHEVPCAAVNSIEDLLTDPQLAHNQLIEESAHPTAGAIRNARPAARFAAHRFEHRNPAPTLGQHTDEVIAELDRDGAKE
jgi:crotonobetainyl-CoA:carnitine CoA-transferase CaiB-like acyl-CoA transferase